MIHKSFRTSLMEVYASKNADLDREKHDRNHDVDVFKVARDAHHLDQLYSIHQSVAKKGYASDADLNSAKAILGRHKQLSKQKDSDEDI